MTDSSEVIPIELLRRIEDASRRVVTLGCARGRTVSTAESCTAGMVASSIADIPGASAVLRGGAVTYCNEIKHEVLGVSEQTLAAHTAVSEATAREMASGSKALFGSDVAVSLTGYAGPGGGTKTEPAGTVYIATCDSAGLLCERHVFSGSRNEVRAQAAARALELVADRLAAL